MSKSICSQTISFLVGALGLSCLLLMTTGEVQASPTQRPLNSTITVGGACGATIQACINSANPNDTVFIPPGVYEGGLTLTKTVNLVGANRETTIIRASPQERTVTISGAAIDASVVISGLTITKSPEDACCGGILITGNAQPSLSNLLISSNVSLNENGSGLHAELGSPLRLSNIRFVGNTGTAAYLYDSITILNSTFENNTGVIGGALGVEGTLVMTDTDFVNNIGTTQGGAVNAFNTHIYGGSFVNNRTEGVGSGSGGALFIWGILYAEGVEFIGNSAEVGGWGGAVYVQNPDFTSVTSVIDSYFENNKALHGYGGGIYVSGNLALTNTNFISNTSTWPGGGASIFQGSKLTVIGGRFERNSATDSSIGEGGGIFAGSADITGTLFISNSAALQGGGASIWHGTQIRNARFEGNHAGFDFATAGGGGGLAVRAASGVDDISAISDTLFLNNSAVGGGGGLVASLLTLDNVRFEKNRSETFGGGWYGQVPSAQGIELVNNHAPLGGGAYFIGPDTELTNCLIEGNDAFNGEGGGLYSGSDKSLIAHCRFVNNVASASGGAIYAVNFQMYDSTFESNHAEIDGGAISSNKGTITTSVFLDNSANGNGGGLSISGGNLAEVSFIANRAVAGGAIYYTGSRFQGTFLGATNILLNRNQATGNGAAAAHLLDGSAFFNHVTVADTSLNPKPAIYYVTSCGNFSGCGQLTVKSSILANHAIGVELGETTGPGEQTSPAYLDYLLFSGVTTPVSALTEISTGEHSFRGNPDFVNLAQENLELGAASQARDIADTDNCPPTDIQRIARPRGLGCDIGAYEAEPVAPALAISPTTFSFIALPGLGQPPAQPLNVANIGAGTLNWSVSGNPSWVSGAPTNGSQNGTIAVQVDPTGLDVGIHQCTLTVSGNATNPQAQATVQLELLDICTPLVLSGDFETGSGTWYSMSSSGNPLIHEGSEMAAWGVPHGGQYAVVLGSQNGDNNELAQDVKLPSGGTLTLEYYYQIISNEESCNFDRARVLLSDTLLAVHDLCPANNTSGWQKGTIDLYPYGNRADRLRFVFQNDALGSPSVFLLDDVAIVAATNAVCEIPILAVTPINLSFSGQAGGVNPITQSVTISNVGTGSLPWTAQADSSWITLNVTDGIGDAELQIGVNLAELQPGDYSGQVIIASDGAQESPQIVNVTLTLNAPPQLQVSPINLTFAGQAGGANPANQFVQISNQGAGDLPWTVQSDSSWITLNTSDGNGNAQLEIGINLTGLTPGDYAGQVTITSNGAQGSPQTIDVTLTVSSAPLPPRLQVNPTSFSFVTQEGDTAPAAQELGISNAGSGALAWTATTSDNWIQLNADHGDAPSKLQVSVNPIGLAVGDHTGQITITGDGALDSPRTIQVLLRINAAPPPPALQVSPSSLSFILSTSSSTPAQQAIDITNLTTGSLAWTATASATWIQLSVNSGNTPATLQVGVKPSGLEEGLHTGQIIVSSQGAEGSPQVVDVYLRIGDPPSAYTFQIMVTTGGETIVATEAEET